MTRKEILLHATLLIITCILFSFFQHKITYSNGEGSYDGVAYAKIVKDLRAGVPPQAELPFLYRLAVPYVVAKLPVTDIVNAFFVVNLIGSIVSFFLFIYWISLFIRTPWVRVTAGLLFILSFHSDLRMAFYHPVEVDQWMTVFLLLGLIVMARGNATSRQGMLFMSGVAFFGSLVRESTMMLPVAYLFLTLRVRIHPDEDRPWQLQLPPPAAFIPLFASAAAVALTHYAVPAQPSFFTATAFNWLYQKPLPDYIYGVLIAFGFIPLLFILFPRLLRQEMRKHPEHLAIAVMVILLAYFGGFATYRIVYWMIPVILLWTAALLERIPRAAMNTALLTTLALFHIYSQRVFIPLPDYYPDLPLCNSPMLITPLNIDAHIYDVIGLGARECSLIGFTQYMATYILLYLIFRFRITRRIGS